MPPVGGVAHVGEGINFYLRLGALGNYLCKLKHRYSRKLRK
jgi:hypothetical protein